MLPVPPPAIGRIEVAYEPGQDLTGAARVLAIREEWGAMNDAFAPAAPDWLVGTQEFDDVVVQFLEV